VTPGAHLQVYIRRRNVQFAEEDLGHVDVIVLSGMDDGLTDSSVRRQCAHYRRRLHKIGPRAYYLKNVHANQDLDLS
jgi:hypothetical protein